LISRMKRNYCLPESVARVLLIMRGCLENNVVKGIWSVISFIVFGTLCWGSGWREVETLRVDEQSIYVEGLDPFARQLNYDLSNLDTRGLYPEILRWGTQRNVAIDYSGGLFSNRLDLGLEGEKRTSANFAPRLMPFGGPVSYSQGRDFTFTLDEPGSYVSADFDFIDYYQYAIPFYESSGEMEFSYGEYGSMTTSMTTRLPMDNLQMAFDVSWREFGDYRDGNDVLLTDSLDLENPKVRYIDEAEDRDIYQIRQIETSGKYTFSPSQYLEFNGRYSDAEGVFFPELRMDAAYDRGSNVSAIYHVKNPSASVQTLSIRAFTSNAQQELNDRWRYSKIRNLEDPQLEDYSSQAKSRSYTQGFDFRAIKDFSDSQIGFGMRRYWQRWEANSEVKGVESEMLPLINQSNLGAYLEGQRYLGNFMLSAAIRIDQFDTQVDGDIGFIRKYRPEVVRRIQDSALSASVRLNYDLSDNNQVHVEFRHASRSPDPNEMYVQYQYERAPGNTLLWLGNPDLESVKNTSVDVGFETNLSRLKFQVKGFYSNVQDMIYLENISPALDLGGAFIGTAMSYNNVDAILYGGETSLEIKLTDSIKFEGGLELLKGRKTRLDGLSADKDLAEMPPLRSRVSIEYNNKLWFGKVEVQMAKAQPDVDESISESPLDGYTVVNFVLGYYLTDNLLWTVGVENVTDQAYSIKNVNIRNPLTNYGVSNEPGRFVYMSLKWGF
jgi:iron complex outermembrane recepter protein